MGPVDQAEIVAGDLILQFTVSSTNSTEGLARKVQEMKAEEKVELSILLNPRRVSAWVVEAVLMRTLQTKVQGSVWSV